jgi:hypothetical protein
MYGLDDGGIFPLRTGQNIFSATVFPDSLLFLFVNNATLLVKSTNCLDPVYSVLRFETPSTTYGAFISVGGQASAPITAKTVAVPLKV